MRKKKTNAGHQIRRSGGDLPACPRNSCTCLDMMVAMLRTPVEDKNQLRSSEQHAYCIQSGDRLTSIEVCMPP